VRSLKDDLLCCGCGWPYIALAGAAASVKVCSVIGRGKEVLDSTGYVRDPDGFAAKEPIRRADGSG